MELFSRRELPEVRPGPLAPLAEQAAARLTAAGQTVAVFEATTGGLIQAALQAVPGASKYTTCGAITYSRRRAAALLGADLSIPRPANGEAYKESKNAWTSALARRMRREVGSTWCISESGACGPTFDYPVVSAGFTSVFVSGPVEKGAVVESPHAGREENMWAFAKLALDLLAECVEEAAGRGAPAEEAPALLAAKEDRFGGVEAEVPAAARAGLPRVADVVALRRGWHEDRVAVARRPVSAGELLLRLPMGRLMHAGFFKEAGHSPLAAALSAGLVGRELETFVAPQTWLALFLMQQRRLGAASEWSAYIDLLPQAFPSVPLFFGEEQWRWLEGSRFAQRVRKHMESLSRQFQTVAELVPGFNRTYALEDFLWARTAISTRVFGWRLPGLSPEDTDFMVPLGDMFNHRSPKQVEWVFNDTTRTLDYWAKEDVPAGGELLISYGGKCNSQYLLHYGFAVPNVSSRWPPVSTVRVALELDADVPDREERERWLLDSRMHDEEGPLPAEEFELKANSFKGAGAESLLGYARLLSLPGGEDFQRRVKGRACRRFASPPRCDAPMSMENERAALGRCLAAVSGALAAYPTTLEEDEALLPTLSGLPHMLVLLRRDEKVVLRWWRSFFALALEALDLSEAEVERRAEETYGRFSPEAQYLRVSLLALLAVDRAPSPARS